MQYVRGGFGAGQESPRFPPDVGPREGVSAVADNARKRSPEDPRLTERCTLAPHDRTRPFPIA